MESKRSCISRTKCCGIPAEKGCYIFSIINMVVVSIGLAACICDVGWTIHLALNEASNDGLEVAINEIICIILSVCTGVSFIFAVLLVYGAHKRKRAFLMTYFVFGVLVEILSIVGAIVYLVSTYDREDPNVEGAVLGSVVLIGCVVYALPLTLVYRAFVALSNDIGLSSGHAKLVNHYPVL